jgi:hypothetical protein
MKRSSALLSPSVVIVAVAVLSSGCSSPGETSSSPSTLQPASRGAGASWVSPDVKHAAALAFVSDDAYDNVYIFSLPDLTLKGTLTGFDEPQGMCSGRSGNIWVANTGTEQTIELSRTGKQLATIGDPDGYNVGCAFDPTTSVLAVTNIFSFEGAGEILVYSCPSCTPKAVTIPTFYYYYWTAYDPKGDLFVDGKSSSGDYLFGEVPAGSSSGFLITVSGIQGGFFPGWMQWYTPKNYLALGGQCGATETACISWVKVKGSKGKVIGETTLLNSQGEEQFCDLTQGAIDPVRGKYVVAGDYEYCGTATTSLFSWRYPVGGKPRHSTTSGLDEPIGTAISVE